MAIPKNDSDKVKLARKLGLVEKGKHDLRRELNRYEKGALTKLINKNKALFQNPQDFQRITVKTKTAENIAGAARIIKKKNGKSHIFVPVEKGETVRVVKGQLEKTKGPMKQKIRKGGADLYEKAKAAFDKLKPGEVIGFQIGGNPRMSRFFTNLKDFETAMDYLRSNNGKWHTPDGTVNSLIDHFSIVTFDNPIKFDPEFDDDYIDHDEDYI
jgi:hypothetical protein